MATVVYTDYLCTSLFYENLADLLFYPRPTYKYEMANPNFWMPVRKSAEIWWLDFAYIVPELNLGPPRTYRSCETPLFHGPCPRPTRSDSIKTVPWPTTKTEGDTNEQTSWHKGVQMTWHEPTAVTNRVINIYDLWQKNKLS